MSILKEKIIRKYSLTIFNYKGFSVLFLEPWQRKQASSYKYISQLSGFLESMQGNITTQESKRLNLVASILRRSPWIWYPSETIPKRSFQFWTGILRSGWSWSHLNWPLSQFSVAKFYFKTNIKPPTVPLLFSHNLVPSSLLVDLISFFLSALEFLQLIYVKTNRRLSSKGPLK